MASPFGEPLGTGPTSEWLFIDRCVAERFSLVKWVGANSHGKSLSLTVDPLGEVIATRATRSHSRQQPYLRVAAHIREWLALLGRLAPGGVYGASNTRVISNYPSPSHSHPNTFADEWLMKMRSPPEIK